MSPISIPGKVTLQKEFIPQSFMYLNPDTFGLWSPSQLSTELWLDAADASTVTTVSNVVSQWNDKSGNVRHVSQSNSTLRPIVDINVQNQLNGITFDGIDDFLETSSAFPIGGNPAFSVFSAHKRGPSFNQRFGWGDNVTFEGATVLGASFAFLGAQNFNAAIQPAAGSVYLYGYTKSPNAINITSNLYLNGANNNGTGHSTGYPNIDPTFPLRVGRLGPITNLFDDGTYFEIIILNSNASTTTRQKIEGYLAHKWGLTGNLPSDHPYKTGAPML
jgi:hypothetical protein